MAVSLEIRIGYLLAKLLAHTECVRGLVETARAVSVILFERRSNFGDKLFVFVYVNSQQITSPY